ncbi:hypothetical protein PCASD_06033 [Puccinia coronata f. sp. avenae]|uniref:Uncharacterized protein n=1 Tax=Puccinia coronata f. sp. avenae TaxID=200324 RepID=A0A2N5VA21_9BASI|nr:hypothetical protein PCASD_06033 [Puccinia coronata f. sp. avenae]
MTVWLPDAKVSERIRQVEQFLELNATFGYDEVEVLVGRLNHVAYLFPQMKCNISSSYQWLKSWVDKHAKRPAPQDVTEDMYRWSHVLCNYSCARHSAVTVLGYVRNFGQKIFICVSKP